MSKITKITVGCLYNLGSYEHVRYELTAEVKDGESAGEAIRGIERILIGLKPVRTITRHTHADLKRRADEIERMRKLPAIEWAHHYGHCEGTPEDVITRFEVSLSEDMAELDKSVERARKARELFDDLGGAAQWKDAKLDWDDNNQDH